MSDLQQLLDKINVSAAGTKFDPLRSVYLKSKTQKLYHSLFCGCITRWVFQLILDFSLNSLKCSVWLKKREKAVIIITLSLHPLACATPCFQMANFCLSPCAACCNSARCLPPGTRCAVRPFAAEVLVNLLELHAHTVPSILPHYVCDYVCVTAGLLWL